MKIIRLQAESFKRLIAVDISPDGGLVEIRGNNAEGKTSVLDSIMTALGGASVQPIKPVRTGEEFAVIRVEAGKGEEVELVVTRSFDEHGDTLKVENGDGAVFTKGQTMLDAIVGRIAFDPLAFKNMPAKEQAAELRRLVPLAVDLDALTRADNADTLARRDVNRDAKALQPRIAAIVLPEPMPAKPDRDAIVSALGSAGETNAAIERERRRRDDESGKAEGYDNTAKGRRDKADNLRREIEQLLADAATLENGAVEIREALAALPPLDEPVDTAKLSAELAEADKALAVHRAAQDRAILQADFDKLRQRSEAFTAAMVERAEQRAKALSEAVMPVEGLSLARVRDVVPGEESDDLIVTYEGEPFSQSSGAQQLRVSMALAMAANPKLRVMLIRDGSLLDKHGMEVVREMATKGDMQVWLESVGDEGAGIIMEGGKVRGAPDPEPLPGPKRRKPKAETAADTVTRPLTDEEAALLANPSPDSATGSSAIPEGLSVDRKTGKTVIVEPAPKPERRKPISMREFTSKPAGDLFGGDK